MISEGKNVKMVPIRYSDVENLFLSDVIDATFWSLDYFNNVFLGNKIVKFTGEEHPEIEASAEAVVICLSDNNKKLLLEDCLSAKQIRTTQEQVISGKRKPSY